MTLFLAIAVPEEAGDIQSAFDPAVYLAEATPWPLGRAVMGRHGWCAYHLGQGSHLLLGSGPARRTHNNDKSEMLLHGLREVLSREACPEIHLLIHVYTGMLDKEAVPVIGEEELSIADLERTLHCLREDVRYVVMAPHRADATTSTV